MDTLSGFLSPSGTFYIAQRWEYLSVATRLVSKLGLDCASRPAIPEDALLENGYICFREDAVYRRDHTRDWETLRNTDSQIKWICDHKRQFTASQMVDVCDILCRFGGMHKFHVAD